MNLRSADVRMSVPLWSLLLGGVSVHVAGKEPTLLYFDIVLLLWLVYEAVWNGFYPLYYDRLVGLGAIYVLLGLLSCVVNCEDINRGLVTVKVLAFGFLAYLIARTAPPRLFTLCLWGAIVGVLLLQNYELVSHQPFHGPTALKDDIGIAMGRSNYIASILVLLIPLGVAAVRIYRGLKRWLSLGCAVLMVAGLICTMSRGAFMAILLACAVSLPFLVKGGVRFKHIALGLALLGAILLLLPRELLLTNAVLVASRLSNPDLAREELMRATWQCFLENPVLGVGPGQLSAAIAHHLMVPFYGSLYANAHNLVLDALAENGLPGGIVMLSMVGIVLRRAWLAVRHQPSVLNNALWIAILAAVIHNMVEASFEGQQFQIIFWIVAALAGGGPVLQSAVGRLQTAPAAA
jgi:O-antigen ligase